MQNHVASQYASVERSKSGSYEHAVARAFGYTDKELAAIPETANLGLSCGNPVALAKLKEGETVLDLGCGAGFDVFTAANKVGPTGRAIGVDMNETMLAKAEAGKAHIKTADKIARIDFIKSGITSIPAVPGASIDCIISNCVINLVSHDEKQLVFDEMFRLLRPGGRVAVSDILARKDLPDIMRANIALYVGCFAGASLVAEYEAYLKNAGFRDVLIVDTKNDLNVYFTAAETNTGSCCGPSSPETKTPTSCCAPEGQMSSVASAANKAAAELGIKDLNEWAGSFQVYAVKPN